MRKKKQSTGGSGLSAGLEGGTTLIAQNTRLKGDVVFGEQVYVNGTIEGDVSAEGSDTATLVVCEGGLVRGEIRAPNVVIDGSVEGDVYASGKLELATKARVSGNVHYNLVEMHLGSVVNGQMISMAETSGTAEVAAVQGADDKVTELR